MKDYIIGLSGLALSLYVYVASDAFKRVGDGLSENPAYYPRILALLLALMSCGILIGAIRKRQALKVNVNRELLLNISKFLGVLILYILFLKPVGFIIGTALFSFAMTWLLGSTRKQAAIYALPISLIVYAVFSYLLKVPLPKGFLTFL
ncbi:MAG: tripartite tricarboxylate transporter TctB family protein [Sphaerochaeta sp.]|jgi:putative tricarboxylic transport membrane protein|nr:tripartite tricarboxylate transporter TctB family protein [Sphaerochaeta sp.]